MDIKSLLHFFESHNDLIFGSTLALFFITLMLLLIRSIGSRGEDSDSSVQATVDVGSLETAMKRVLESHQLAAPVARAGATSATANVIDVDDLANDDDGSGVAGSESKASGSSAAGKTGGSTGASDKDLQIQKLTQELEQARSAVKTTPAGTNNADLIAEYHKKIEELQARLAEYEIIEDDIADLSLFREENQRLKAEIEDLKKGKIVVTGTGDGPRTLSDESSDEPGVIGKTRIAGEDDVAEAPTKKARPVEPESEGFQPDPNDALMQEFSAAVDMQRAPKAESETSLRADAFPDPEALAAHVKELEQSGVLGDVPQTTDAAPAPEVVGESTHPLDETMDTDKMLSEVASLSEVEPSDDALDESLDTDKLLAEVGDLQGASAPAPVAASTADSEPAPAAAAADSDAPQVVAAEAAPEVDVDDENGVAQDVLSEFKDVTDPSGKTGS